MRTHYEKREFPACLPSAAGRRGRASGSVPGGPGIEGILLLAILALFPTAPASAQAQGRQAPVALTIQWGPVFYDRPAGTGGAPKGTRVSGSLEVKLGSDWSAGIWVTSWARDIALRKDLTSSLSDRAEAALSTLFVRRQVRLGSGRIFAGAGAGVAWTETMTGGLGTISLERRNRPVLSAGLGTLLALHQPLFLVASVDHTRILRARANSRELRFGTALAVGLSLR